MVGKILHLRNILIDEIRHINHNQPHLQHHGAVALQLKDPGNTLAGHIQAETRFYKQ
ncbi:hypothetical protein D3C76_1606180 [compost metagenome]